MSQSICTMYLIKRRPESTREELLVHWFKNHMPGVIERSVSGYESGRLHATKYVATVFDADKDGNHPFDGVAQLWWDRNLPKPKAPFGDPPADTFQEKALPYVPWATEEHIIMDGELDNSPNTLNEPYPFTRSGFFKKTFFVPVVAGTDMSEFFTHWLQVHVPNVKSVMEQVGGFRYTVAHSLHPDEQDFAGMAELYFPNETAWREYLNVIQPDGLEQWVDNNRFLALSARTEMVGIPG